MPNSPLRQSPAKLGQYLVTLQSSRDKMCLLVSNFPKALRANLPLATSCLTLPRPSFGCHLLRWGVWKSLDTICMGGLLLMADKGKILRITWRYHITHKMELLLFSSKTYCVSLGQRKEHAANPGRQVLLKIYASLNYLALNSVFFHFF